MAEGNEAMATYGSSREDQAIPANATRGKLDGDYGVRPASLYCSLLAAALSLRDRAGQPILSEALGDVVQARGHATMGGRIGRGGSSVADALSDQIAYDVALIRYARCLGISCRPSEFDPPSRGRRIIERWISERGAALI